jgi:hypothetical protein
MPIIYEDAVSYDEACLYMKNRIKEMLRFGAKLVELRKTSLGNLVAFIDIDGCKYISIFILFQNRNQRSMNENYVRAINSHYSLEYREYSRIYSDRIITMPHCKIEEYLYNFKYPYRLLDPHRLGYSDFTEYSIIYELWKDRVAERTGIPYMNHVHEGLRVIKEYNYSERAMRIFALHGVLQNCYKDNAVALKCLSDVSYDIIIGAMEYRAIANAHLSYHDSSTLRLSEDDDVNIALVADKVQNRRDFERFHLGTHKRSDELSAYFERWLGKLGVSEERYHELAGVISEGD